MCVSYATTSSAQPSPLEGCFCLSESEGPRIIQPNSPPPISDNSLQLQHRNPKHPNCDMGSVSRALRDRYEELLVAGNASPAAAETAVAEVRRLGACRGCLQQFRQFAL